jgi:hypothetical protein
MKKILIILSFFALITSCGKLEDLNKNIKDPLLVPGETLFTGAQQRVINQVVNSNVNRNNFRLFVQYWTETTYTDESNYDLTTRTTPDYLWDLFYLNALKNFDEAAKVIADTPIPFGEDPAVQKNKLAIIEIMSVYCYDVLVETFGDIPYSEALDIETPLPEYDDGMTIFKDLLVRLDAAISKLDGGFGSYGVTDNMYQGDVNLWAKFANSLKLRMALLIADADNEAAKEAVESAAPNLFSSNEDNAKVVYLTAPPNTNPIYIDLVASGRHDFVPANTVVDTMNYLEDPRRKFYFTQVDTSTEAGVVKLAYSGGINGASNDFLAYSHVADLIQKPTFPGTLFDYAEVEFLLAEAVERGFTVGGTAEEHYINAITASIEDWGGTAADATEYLANTKVAYATAEGDWKHKIGVQSWLAYYNRGFEAWTQWRKLDYPLLVAPPDALSPFPVRYTYPIKEQTLNGNNWETASTKIGGDAVDTKLFWDKF